MLRWPAHEQMFAVTATADLIVTCGRERGGDYVTLWRFDGTLVDRFRLEPDTRDYVPRQLAIANGEILLATYYGVLAWPIDNVHAAARVVSGPANVQSLAVTPSGLVIVCDSLDRLRWVGRDGLVREAAIALGATRVQADGDAALVVFNRDRIERHTLDGACDVLRVPATCVVAHDGNGAVGCTDGVIARWRPGTSEELTGHSYDIVDLAASNDVLVSADRDDVIRWWRGNQTIVTGSHAQYHSMALAPNGTTVTIGDGAVCVWPECP